MKKANNNLILLKNLEKTTKKNCKIFCYDILYMVTDLNSV